MGTDYPTTSEIKRSYIFKYREDPRVVNDRYFCTCGHTFLSNEIVEADEIVIKHNSSVYSSLNEMDILGNALFKVTCPQCNKDYSDDDNLLITKNVDEDVCQYYHLKDNKKTLSIVQHTYHPIVKKNTVVGPEIIIKDVIKSIILNRNSRSVLIVSEKLDDKKITTEKTEIDLDNLFNEIHSFFSDEDVKEIKNFIAIHEFIGLLASLIRDSKNIDIINGLLSTISGGLNIQQQKNTKVLRKVISLLLSMFIYSNLSTIALTKNPIFLYELLEFCNLPSSDTLRENNITSPVKMFNFLVQKDNIEIQEEIDSHDKDLHEYAHKSVRLSSGQEIKLTHTQDFAKLKDSAVGDISIKKGELQVREKLQNIKLSPYIYKKVKNFSDYKTLIKWKKLVSYDGLIDLVKKYDIEFLIKLFPLLEFRGDIDPRRLNQFITLAHNFLEKMAQSRLVSFEDKIRQHIAAKKQKKSQVKQEELKIDYRTLVYFKDVLITYDACVNMLASLKWDFNKDLAHIKMVDELGVYHNKLADYYNSLNDKDKYDQYMKFIKGYKYLESYDDTKLTVKICATPQSLIGYAREFHNSAGSYVGRVAKRKYLILIVEDKSKERKEEEYKKYMMGFMVTKYGLEFDQIKAHYEQQANDRFKQAIMDYLKDMDISYKPISDLRIEAD